MRPLNSAYFENRDQRVAAQQTTGRADQQLLQVDIHFESSAQQREFERLGGDFIEQFQDKFPSIVKRVAGASESAENPRIFHLWSLPSADAVLYMIRELADMPDYASLDALVIAEEQNLYTPITDDEVHGRGQSQKSYKYARVHYKMPVSEMDGFSIDLSSQYREFEKTSGLTLEDTLFAVTGRVYDIMQLWVVPTKSTEESLTGSLIKAPWMHSGVAETITSVEVLRPTQYDRPRAAAPVRAA